MKKVMRDLTMKVTELQAGKIGRLETAEIEDLCLDIMSKEEIAEKQIKWGN